MKISDKLIENLIPGQSELFISKDEYIELIRELQGSQPTVCSPIPPIKKQKEERGFFSYSYEVEYDFNDPVYLKQVEEYHKNLESKKEHVINLKKLVLNGPYCQVEIKVFEE